MELDLLCQEEFSLFFHLALILHSLLTIIVPHTNADAKHARVIPCDSVI